MISLYIDMAVICNHTDMACALLANSAENQIKQYMVMAMFTFFLIVYNNDIHLYITMMEKVSALSNI